ncbi:MAG: response regulator [Thermodesulfobacteriota bacterium]
MNILVVDDEPVMLDSIRIALESRRFRFTGVQSAHAALNMISNHPEAVDMVITDYLMPEMTGLELLRAIRERHDNLPVILVTAYSEKELVIQALKNRCDGFLEKPFSPHQLFAEIDRLQESHSRKNGTCEQKLDIPHILHQINNPLVAISGYAQLIQMKTPSNNGTRQYVDRILEAVGQIHQINKKILKAPSIDNPQTSDSIGSHVVAIDNVIDQSLKLYEGIFALSGIQLEKRFFETGLQVQANAFDIEQALKNLISNALDAMTDSTVKQLTITVGRSKDRQSVEIIVQDTGCGIPESLQARIFDKYVTGKPQGNGIGLAVVKANIEKYHGSVSFHSTPGAGTAFTIRLPMANSQQRHPWRDSHLETTTSAHYRFAESTPSRSKQRPFLRQDEGCSLSSS